MVASSSSRFRESGPDRPSKYRLALETSLLPLPFSLVESSWGEAIKRLFGGTSKLSRCISPTTARWANRSYDHAVVLYAQVNLVSQSDLIDHCFGQANTSRVAYANELSFHRGDHNVTTSGKPEQAPHIPLTGLCAQQPRRSCRRRVPRDARDLSKRTLGSARAVLGKRYGHPPQQRQPAAAAAASRSRGRSQTRDEATGGLTSLRPLSSCQREARYTTTADLVTHYAIGFPFWTQSWQRHEAHTGERSCKSLHWHASCFCKAWLRPQQRGSSPMEIGKHWEMIRAIFEENRNSCKHFAVASVGEDGMPHVAPIGALFLREDRTGQVSSSMSSLSQLRAM